MQVARLSIEHEYSQQQRSGADESEILSYPGTSGTPCQPPLRLALICYIVRWDLKGATKLSSEYGGMDSGLLKVTTHDAGRQLRVEARRQAACPQWIDIDTADAENPMACTDYVGSIMEHLFQSEVRSALLSSSGALGIEQCLLCTILQKRSHNDSALVCLW